MIRGEPDWETEPDNDEPSDLEDEWNPITTRKTKEMVNPDKLKVSLDQELR
jgi:hypothetical protein